MPEERIHPRHVIGYEHRLEDLVMDVHRRTTGETAIFYASGAGELRCQAERDLKRGRKQLACLLKAAANEIENLTNSLGGHDEILYDCSEIEKLAVDLHRTQYRTVSDFYQSAIAELRYHATRVPDGQQSELAKRFNAASRCAETLARHFDEIWKLCEPHMQEELKEDA